MARTRAHVRTALQRERQQLLESLSHEEPVEVGASDVADIATSRVEQIEDDRERQRRMARVEQIEASLQRLDDGTWGVCESCGDQIAGERMQALPTARTCLSCAAARR